MDVRAFTSIILLEGLITVADSGPNLITQLATYLRHRVVGQTWLSKGAVHVAVQG